MTARRGVLALLLVVAVVAVGVAAAPAGPRGFARRAGQPAVRLGTPLLSVRRVADALVAHRAEARLQAAATKVLADPSLAPWTSQSCAVVTIGDRRLVERAPAAPVIPASTMKLLTATAAVDVLGAATTLTTRLVADSAPAGGVVQGDLQVVGGGDPVIETDADASRPGRRQPVLRTRMESLADAAVAAGVRQVTGGVRADESRYDRQRARPGWKASYAADGEVAPLSALLVDDGEDAGQKPVPQPALQFAQVLTTMLQARGVLVGGGPTVGAASGTAEVAAIPSLPVRDLVAEMVRESDNTTAELLLKEVGHVAGAAGTSDAGLTAARAALQRRGLDVSGLQARDGSGLDRADRATCDLLVKALQSQGRSSELAASLPVAGQTGTLAKRFVGTAAAGRLRAKTGTLDGVSALVGWVDPSKAGPPPLAFAVVANGVPPSLPVTRLGDAFGIALATWGDAPAADAVAPLPLAATTP